MLGAEMGGCLPCHDNRNGRERPHGTGRDQWRLLPEKARLAGATSSLVIAVEDVRAAMRQVTEAGGKVLGEPMEIPGVGQYVSSSTPKATA